MSQERKKPKRDTNNENIANGNPPRPSNGPNAVSAQDIKPYPNKKKKIPDNKNKYTKLIKI